MADRRLADPTGQELRRDEPIEFRFDGRRRTGLDGDTIASALAADGVDVLSRSFKYHRPRGVLCCDGPLPELPGRREWRAERPRLRYAGRARACASEAQNAWPSLRRDLLS